MLQTSAQMLRRKVKPTALGSHYCSVKSIEVIWMILWIQTMSDEVFMTRDCGQTNDQSKIILLECLISLPSNAYSDYSFWNTKEIKGIDRVWSIERRPGCPSVWTFMNIWTFVALKCCFEHAPRPPSPPATPHPPPPPAPLLCAKAQAGGGGAWVGATEDAG